MNWIAFKTVKFWNRYDALFVITDIFKCCFFTSNNVFFFLYSFLWTVKWIAWRMVSLICGISTARTFGWMKEKISKMVLRLQCVKRMRALEYAIRFNPISVGILYICVCVLCVSVFDKWRVRVPSRIYMSAQLQLPPHPSIDKWMSKINFRSFGMFDMSDVCATEREREG